MKIQTYSVLVGSRACDAHCPYCVSRMTPDQGIDLRIPEINWRNFDIGCKFAKDSGVSTVLLTGKGEPILFPDQISKFLEELQKYEFPLIELQTNGILFWQKREKYEQYLKGWYKQGLTTIAVSVVHWRKDKNQEIFQPAGPYMNLWGLLRLLHQIGFSVRLSCVMFKDGIDCAEKVREMIKSAKEGGIEQISIRPVEAPEKSEDPKADQWVEEHKLDNQQLDEIREFLKKGGTEIMRLVHGAIIYDVGGQNICLTNALTIEPSSEDVRQLIFFPDGHLRYDWQYPGAILL